MDKITFATQILIAVSKYKLVIFDCDGVLVDSEMISAEVIADVIRPLGVNMTTEEAFREFVGGSMSETIIYVEKKMGRPPPIDIEKEYRKRTFEAYKKEMKPVAGVEAILDRLSIKKCVASNGPKNKINFNLEVAGLSKYFEQRQIFSAYDIEIWKPAPDLYLNAARTMGAEPNECIVVEDSVNGLHAASSAGILCLGNSNPLKPLPEDIVRTEVYRDLYEIGNRLKSLGVMDLV